MSMQGKDGVTDQAGVVFELAWSFHFLANGTLANRWYQD